MGEPRKAVSRRRSSVTRFVMAALVGAVAIWAWASARTNKRTANAVEDFDQLISMGTNELNRLDIGRMNLLCVERLRGGDGSKVRANLAELDRMVRQVRAETERHYRKFQTKPEEFNRSDAYFRMLCLVTVLQQDFGVRYSPSRARPNDGPSEPNEAFFADSRDIFLHGLLGPERTGTCASLPVLYTAVGRRLGYPLKLVVTRNHLFVRWEDSRERLNIEATSEGLTTYDDDYYRRWPFPMSPEEEQAERYLQSLTPAEELAVFLSLRTNCLLATERFREALECQEHACRLAPHSPSQRQLLEHARAGANKSSDSRLSQISSRNWEVEHHQSTQNP
jgi:hypothetical protein